MKQKTRIMIYILIAAAVVIMGILALLSNKNGTPSADKHIELGQSYLIELSYDKAVLEFTQAIEIDPKSPEAYIGLAETYIGLGDIEKAVETLERGLEETADEKIKALLDELIDETEKKMTADITTAFVSEPPVITTAETQTSVEMVDVPLFIGLKKEEAEKLCNDIGLECKFVYSDSDKDLDIVIRQNVPETASVPVGFSLQLSLSNGNPSAETTSDTAVTEITEYATISTIGQTVTVTSAVSLTENTNITEENEAAVEDEEKYDEDGMLLYKKKNTTDGYELYWYFRRCNKLNLIVIESYDKNDVLTYSKVNYENNGRILTEGKTKQTENGYIINGKKNDNGDCCDLELNEMRNVIYEKWICSNICVIETWFGSDLKPTKEIQVYDDSSTEFTYADGYVKTYKTYSNGKLILYTEYETDERDKARKENIYDDDELICVHYYDSNDTLRKQITYMDDGTEYITYFDEYGNYIPDY